MSSSGVAVEDYASVRIDRALGMRLLHGAALRPLSCCCSSDAWAFAMGARSRRGPAARGKPQDPRGRVRVGGRGCGGGARHETRDLSGLSSAPLRVSPPPRLPPSASPPLRTPRASTPPRRRCTRSRKPKAASPFQEPRPRTRPHVEGSASCTEGFFSVLTRGPTVRLGPSSRSLGASNDGLPRGMLASEGTRRARS